MMVGRKVSLMPCTVLTDQLKLSSDLLSWSAGARFGNISFFFKDLFIGLFDGCGVTELMKNKLWLNKATLDLPAASGV